jgi:hypothetical protein
LAGAAACCGDDDCGGGAAEAAASTLLLLAPFAACGKSRATVSVERERKIKGKEKCYFDLLFGNWWRPLLGRRRRRRRGSALTPDALVLCQMGTNLN